jgi:hypothetical protein
VTENGGHAFITSHRITDQLMRVPGGQPMFL